MAPRTPVSWSAYTSTIRARPGPRRPTRRRYTSYARVARTRTNASGGMTAATATDPASTSPHTTNIDFPESTGAEPGGGGILDFFAVGELYVRRRKILLVRGRQPDNYGCRSRGDAEAHDRNSNHARLVYN